MVTLPLPRLPDGPSIRWRTVVVIVLGKASWDCIGLLAGDAAYAAPSYDVLRSMPPVGGMRLRGLILVALTIGAFAAAYLAARTGREKPLRLCLGLYAAWYMAWAAGLAAASFYHGQVLSWNAPTSVLVVAVLALIAARATPRQVGGA